MFNIQCSMIIITPPLYRASHVLPPAGISLFMWLGVIPSYLAYRLHLASKTGGLHSDANFVAVFGSLYERYRPEVWWWELVVICRGWAMAAVVAFVPYWLFWQPLGFFAVHIINNPNNLDKP